MSFDIVPVAAWTQRIADNRAAALERIENDPARAAQWAEHLAARRAYGRVLGRRGRDPLFIHTPAYDDAVEAAQAPYLEHFEADLGAGGWRAINEAHYALIATALDRITAEAGDRDGPVRVLILFGAWHKYWFLRQLERRDDVHLVDARAYFAQTR